MKKEIIQADDTYALPWQFNQAVKVTEGRSILFFSALAGYEPDGTLDRDNAAAQAEAAFENLRKVVEAAGGTMADIVKTTVYVREDFRIHRDALREVRSRYFTGDFPASTLIQVAGFANPDYLFEIEAIAILD